MRKNSLTRKVRRAYSQDTLARLCMLPEAKVGRAYGMETVCLSDRSEYRGWKGEDYYHFRDNGSRVLAVAHLDTVVRPGRRTPHFTSTQYGPMIQSGALDDRLGAYVILNLLPRLGVTTDWLLTVGEESGASTAEYFKPAKDYDHVIEFDRMGTDVVMYQYEDRASREAVAAAGAQVGSGSYSDIAYLEHLGVKAFNWGVGYRGHYHSEEGYAYLDDTFAMVGKYLRFHDQNAGITMAHEEDRYSGYGRSSWDVDYGKDYLRCDFCDAKAVDYVTGYCQECGSCADCGELEGDGCMCYVPSHIRPEASKDSDDTRPDSQQLRAWSDYLARKPADSALTWQEYLAKRPAAADDAGVSDRSDNHAACIVAFDGEAGAHQHGDDPTWWVAQGDQPARPNRSPSIAPAWSEHAPEQMYDSRRHREGLETEISKTIARLSEAGISHHEVAKSRYGWTTGAHDAAPSWAGVCDRCAARWPQAAADAQRTIAPLVREFAHRAQPVQRGGADKWPVRQPIGTYAPATWHDANNGIPGHLPGWWGTSYGCALCAERWPEEDNADEQPAADSARSDIPDMHPETDCPGCVRCLAPGTFRIATGAIHVIPAHTAGTSDGCPVCADMLSAADR